LLPIANGLIDHLLAAFSTSCAYASNAASRTLARVLSFPPLSTQMVSNATACSTGDASITFFIAADGTISRLKFLMCDVNVTGSIVNMSPPTAHENNSLTGAPKKTSGNPGP